LAARTVSTARCADSCPHHIRGGEERMNRRRVGHNHWQTTHLTKVQVRREVAQAVVVGVVPLVPEVLQPRLDERLQGGQARGRPRGQPRDRAHVAVDLPYHVVKVGARGCCEKWVQYKLSIPSRKRGQRASPRARSRRGTSLTGSAPRPGTA